MQLVGLEFGPGDPNESGTNSIGHQLSTTDHAAHGVRMTGEEVGRFLDRAGNVHRGSPERAGEVQK